METKEKNRDFTIYFVHSDLVLNVFFKARNRSVYHCPEHLRIRPLSGRQFQTDNIDIDINIDIGVMDRYTYTHI